MDSALVQENTTRMSSTPTEQMIPTPSAIMTDLAKAQPSSILVINLFQSNAIKLKCLAMQIDVAMNAKEEGERRHLLQKMLPIIAQEDPYMIRLLSQQKYIKIVKTTIARWVEGISLPFFLSSMIVLVSLVSNKITI